MRYLFALALLLAAFPAEARTRARTSARAVPDPVAARYAFAPAGAAITTGTMLEPLTITGPATPVCSGGACWTAPANTPAIGPDGMLVYGPRVSRILNNQRSSANTATGGMLSATWTKRGTATVAAGCVTDPFGGCTADEITVGAVNTNDAYQYPTGFAANAALAQAVWIQRVTTTGSLSIVHPNGAANGAWSVNLALLPDAWERLVPGHAALTVTTAFKADQFGSAGILLGAASGTVTVRIHRPWQVEGTVPGPDAEVGSSPLSVAGHAVSVPNAVAGAEWCYSVTATPSGAWNAGLTRGLASGGIIGAANSWAIYVIGNGTPVCSLWGTDGSERYHAGPAALSDSAERAFACCGTSAGPSLWIDGARSTNALLGVGTGVMSELPATVKLGVFTSGNDLRGSIREHLQCRAVDGGICR
jgi:hypothetical protein